MSTTEGPSARLAARSVPKSVSGRDDDAAVVARPRQDNRVARLLQSKVTSVNRIVTGFAQARGNER